MEPSDDNADGRVSDPHTSSIVMGFDAAGERNARGLQSQPSSTSIPGFTTAALEEDEESSTGDGKQQQFLVGGEEEVGGKRASAVYDPGGKSAKNPPRK